MRFVIEEDTLQGDGFKIHVTDIPVTEVGGRYRGNQAIVNAVIVFEAVDD